MRVEATRFTITPPIDVVDVHSVQVHVERRRDGKWIAGDGRGMWFDRDGNALFHCQEHYNLCATDFATAMWIGAEAAQTIADRWVRFGVANALNSNEIVSVEPGTTREETGHA